MIDEIKKGTKIFVLEKNKAKKVDSVSLVEGESIFITHKGIKIEIPTENIANFSEDKIILNFEGKDAYKSFKDTEAARLKGLILVPEFEKFFPQGINHEVYDFSKTSKYCICGVPVEGLEYIIQQMSSNVITNVTVLDLVLDPNYAFVYYRSKNLFGSVPLNQTQKDVTQDIERLIKQTWRLVPMLTFLVVANENFQNSLKMCSNLFKNVIKAIKKHPEDPEGAYKPILQKLNKKLQRNVPQIDLLNGFEPLFEKVRGLNRGLKEGLDRSLRNIKAGPSAGQTAAAHLIGAPAVKLKIEPLYIVPLLNKTLVINLIPLSGFTKKPFEYYQSIYIGVKDLYQYLK
ncbi:MAG: hypothetical protein ACFFCM_15015 [Promethearchaeota archaeon]